jgi:RimJ/RimL family protein N-acetyltransferase
VIPTLTTERLRLRPFTPDDAPAVERLAGAWEVAETTLNIPHPYPSGGGAEWIATHAPAWDAGARLTLAIAPRERPSELVGAVGLGIEREHGVGELGYWIARETWGRGYATEAALAIVRYGFETLGLRRIQARHFTRNAPSGRVMQKLGMRHEGIQRGVYVRWGKPEDVAVYALLAAEWAIAGAPPPARTRFEHAEPILRVEDMSASLRYYVDVLGFTNAPWGNDDFTCVSRDGASIYLCRGGQGHPGTWAWIGVDDAAMLHEEYRARGATIRMPPTNFAWALEMHVEDPDGHVLRFGSEPLPVASG